MSLPPQSSTISSSTVKPGVVAAFPANFVKKGLHSASKLVETY